MALKDLLVHLDDSWSRADRMAGVVALAAAHGAHVLARCLIADPSPKSHVRASRRLAEPTPLERAAEAGAEAIVTCFQTVATRAGVAVETRVEHVLHTEIAAAVVAQARRVDLAVLGQIDPRAAGPSPHFLIGDVLIGAGRPVLVVPHGDPGATIGRQVTIAWDGSREAARALGDALPILVQARTVRVLAVGRDRTMDGDQVLAHLARHGVDATLTGIDDQGDVAASLLDAVTETGADLLVMGAYGHSRIREFILGGVTRRLLRGSAVSLLLSH